MNKRKRDGSSDPKSWLRGGKKEDPKKWSYTGTGEEAALNYLFKEADAFDNRERIPISYWCDCARSNLSYFGELPKRDKGNPMEQAYSMVPVQVDKYEACEWCGHATVARRTKNTDPYAIRDKFNRTQVGCHSANMRRVYAINVDTGHRLDYPSVNAAAAAGYSSGKIALRTGNPLKGYKWYYTEPKLKGKGRKKSKKAILRSQRQRFGMSSSSL